MSRQTRPPPRGMSHADDSGSGVEDSLRGPVGFSRTAPIAGPVFSRPAQTNNSTYAFAATPDSVPSSSTLPSQQVGWQPARASPQLGYPSARIPSFDGTPQAGPSTLFNAAPPRIERPQPAARGAHMGPPLPSFAPSIGAAGNNLFIRPPVMSAYGSPSEASVSSSFSFAPRTLFAAPAGMPPLARPVRPTTATTATGNMVPTTPMAATNLDAAALAAERRIREARAATRTDEARRSVSFSPITPQNGVSYGVPPPVHRAVGVGAPSRPTNGTDVSLSHLGRTTTHHHANASLSTETPFARPAATRLFPPTTTSDAGQSASWTADDPSSISSANPPPPVRLRKWDGTATLVPSWLVSDCAESVVEEDHFDYDTIQRFDIPCLLSGHALRTLGQGQPPQSDVEEGEDVVKAILDTQLGLRGLHGWYGHTYLNRPPASPVAGSKKRRRPSSSSSLDPNANPDEDPIVVYDSFGRIRGTITLPNYTHHGGPALPLPSPSETFALRHAAAQQLVLHSATSLAEKEARLVTDEQLLRQRWRVLAGAKGEQTTVRSERFCVELKTKRKAKETFQAAQRKGLLKGLQNALLDSTLVAPRRQVVASDD